MVTASTASTSCSTCWGAMSWERRCASTWFGQASRCRWTSSSASGHAERDDDHERSVPERPGGTAPGQCGRDRQWTEGSACGRRGGHRLVRRLVRDQRARRDAERDIAVVRAAGAGVPAVVAGDPYALRSGSLVFAVGHPFGVRDAVSVGVLQAVSPLPRGYGLNGNGSFVWIQADVRLAPGNSGGPVGDAQGRVIGVAAMVVSGMALAVPVPDVERFLSGLT